MEVKIIRSHRRRRTVSARLVEDTLLVNAPLELSRMRLDKIIAGFKVKFEKKKLKDELERKQGLSDIATRLNEKYFANQLKINSIEYVTGQSRKFGCCNYNSGNIRISHRIGLMPAWVRDYVVIHEMAHLIEPNHSRAFWAIVSRYKLAERARGFLLAAAGGTPAYPIRPGVKRRHRLVQKNITRAESALKFYQTGSKLVQPATPIISFSSHNGRV